MKRSFVILMHNCYWLLYFFLVTTFILVMPTGHKFTALPIILKILFISPIGVNLIIPGILGFYFFYLILFPHFLQQKKFPGLVLLGLAVPLLLAFSGMLLSSFFFVNDAKMSGGDRMGLLLFSAVLTCIHGIIALVMRGFITWYTDIKLKEELNKKNFETELALVKSQINPHFLFNTINNIDVLIQKDPVKASAFLNKLSDIMRFMLYETKTEKIPLAKEMGYIEKYIDLQKIRTSNADYVDYRISGDTGTVTIAPMLFIPFIENAFKYAGNSKTANAISIRFVITGDELEFRCENVYDEDMYTNLPGGLGNELIRKRLLLMYPKQHKLTIINGSGTYIVKLNLYFGN